MDGALSKSALCTDKASPQVASVSARPAPPLPERIKILKAYGSVPAARARLVRNAMPMLHALADRTASGSAQADIEAGVAHGEAATAIASEPQVAASVPKAHSITTAVASATASCSASVDG